MNKRLLASSIVMATPLLALTSTGAASARPLPEPGTGPAAVPAVSCLGGAKNWSIDTGTDEAPHTFGNYYTTSRCNDINLKVTTWGNGSPGFRVCFKPTSGKDYCNSGTIYKKSTDNNVWRTIATDVKDGTRFSVQIDLVSHTFKGQLAY